MLMKCCRKGGVSPPAELKTKKFLKFSGQIAAE
jgi:hypothetical protein